MKTTFLFAKMDLEEDNTATDDYHRNLVKYILNNLIAKFPIKKSDMITHAINSNTKLFNRIFRGAKEELSDVYGIQILEVDSKSVKQYICVSTSEAASSLEFNPRQRKELALLFIILSFIFMNGGSVTEDALFQFLRKLDIVDEEINSYFGENIKKSVSETFVKQLYLKKEKQELESATEKSILYSWGFRSHHEFKKKLLLDEVAKLLKREPQSFIRQYLELGEEEEGNNNPAN